MLRALGSAVFARSGLLSGSALQRSTLSCRCFSSAVTFKHQRDLPRLPIPKLEDTCNKFLTLVEPLVSTAEYEDTKEVVGWFKGKEGQLLHQKLKDLDEESQTSWLEGFWDSMYLEGRYPVPIHSNPYFILTDTPVVGSPGAQLTRATSLVYSTLKYVRQLREKVLAPDKEGGQYLCMSQHPKLFGSARIPYTSRDDLVTNRNATDIVVMRHNHMFVMPVMDRNDNVIDREELRAKLEAICEEADRTPTKDEDGTAVGGVGLMTTEERDRWAAVRAHLVSDDGNARLVDAVDSALLVLCLDGEDSASLQESSEAFLHNYGTNRWFDKFQLIVEKNGRAGINMEHSPVDGHTALRYATEIHADELNDGALAMPEPHTPVKELPAPTKLDWVLDADVVEAITSASRSFDELCERTQSAVLPFDRFGKEQIKAMRCSPDAFVQMAYQLAYFQLHRRISSTYESANTKGFLHGRTETIRTVSPASEAFCRRFDLEKPAESRDLLMAAVKQHVQHSRDCKNGMGVDRHLFGLRNLAKHQQQRIANYRIPSLFSDKGYQALTSNVLSTSNCGGDAMQLFGFGPVHPGGLGIGYMIQPNAINISVSSFRNEAEDFAEAVEKALVDMETVCK